MSAAIFCNVHLVVRAVYVLVHVMTVEWRELWLGGIPLGMTEGEIIAFFLDSGFPAPWKCVVRLGKSGMTQYGIATFESHADARSVLMMRLKWQNGQMMTIRFA